MTVPSVPPRVSTQVVWTYWHAPPLALLSAHCSVRATHACIATKMARRSGSALSSQRVRPCGPDDVARASLMWRYSTYGMSDPAAWGMDAVRRRVLHACGAIQLRLTAVRACRRAAASSAGPRILRPSGKLVATATLDHKIL
jgi:hypothetical protein